jgi:hypothetical protein
MAEPIGALGSCGIAIEGGLGAAVKPLYQLDLISESLLGKGGPIRSRAITGSRTVKKAPMGAYRADGDLSLEVTPDKFTTLLYATLTGNASGAAGGPVTTGTAGTGTITSTGTAVVGVGTAFLTELAIGSYIVATGGGQTRIVSAIADNTHLTVSVAFSPDVAGVAFTTGPFTHVFRTGPDLKPLTVQMYRPQATGQYFVYAGCKVERLSFRSVIDAILEATVSLASAYKETIYSADQSDSSVSISALEPFVFHQGTVNVGGAGNTDTNNWQVDIATGLSTPKGIGSGRYPNRATPGDSMISGSFDMVFDSITQHRKWMGATADTSPIALGTAKQAVSLSLTWNNAATANIMILAIGNAYFTSSEPPITGRDGVIIQRVGFEALYYSSDSSDVKITMVGPEPATLVTTSGSVI